MQSTWLIALPLTLLLAACPDPLADSQPSCDIVNLEEMRIERTYELRLAVSESKPLTYNIYGCDGEIQFHLPYVWESSNPTVATVDSRGVATGQSNGKTEILVSEERFNTSATIKITVATPPEAE